MNEKQNNHYFNEWWIWQSKLYASSKKVFIEDFDPKSAKVWVNRFDPCVHTATEPAPIFMMEWAEYNPFPGISRDAFIVTLAKRIETLEAALAEKGGDR